VEQEGVPAYDRSKADGARLVRMGIAKGLDAVLIHPVGVIGPNDRKPSQIGGALVQMTQRKLPALVSGGFNWVDVRDVAAAALSAETRGRKGEHYIVAGQWVSVREIGALVQKATGVAPPRIVTPMWLARAALPFVATYSWVTRTELPYNTASLHALRNHRYISFDKAQRELDHHPRPFEETITDTLNWFREQGLVRV
jgi:dihydroflavonol-4-reductase